MIVSLQTKTPGSNHSESVSDVRKYTKLKGSSLPVEEYTADIIVADGWFLGAGSHAERPEETVDQNGELMDVLCLCFHHVEDDLIPLPHALSMRGTDVVLDNDLPLPPAQPATHEALYLHSHSIKGVLYLFIWHYFSLPVAYLFDLFNIRVLLLLVAMVRLHPLLGFA